MKKAKKGQNAHKAGGTFKKDSNKKKQKKQGFKQLKQTVPMKNGTTLKNRQKMKKRVCSLVKNSESKPDIVKLKKDKNTNSVVQAKQELNKKSNKKFSSKRKKSHKQEINDVENANENIKTSKPQEENQNEQKATNKSGQKQNTKVHKLRVLIEKRIREEENAGTLPANQNTENLKCNNATADSEHNKEEAAINEPNNKRQKHQQPQSLRDKMMARLKASRFRFINEGLYTSNSSESKNYFHEDPDAFKAYHEGYKQQVEQWPVNPLEVIISSIQKLPKDYIIADLGCGEGRLATAVPQKVHSFDLVSLNDWVKACDVTHTPLLTEGVHVVVFCLSLMGTNLNDYIFEANRVLRKDGILKIAEVESRFDGIDNFIKALNEYGFTNTWKDLSHNLFYFMDFKKVEDISSKRNKLPAITLKPCFYKKR